MDNVIAVSIENRIASCVSGEYICGNSDFVLAFSFDSEWDSHNSKTARFKHNGTHTDVIFTGNICPIPIISDVIMFSVGVFAGSLKTTTPAFVRAKKSILCGGTKPSEPPIILVPSNVLDKMASKEYVENAIKCKEEFDGVRINEHLIVRSLDGDGAVMFSVRGTTDEKDQRLILESDRNAPRICGVGEPVDDQDVANKKYVDEAVAQAGSSGGTAATDVTDIVNEMLQSDAAIQLNEGDFLLYLAINLYDEYQPGNYISHGGLGKYELYYSTAFSSGGVRMKFMGNAAEFFVNELGQWSGFVLHNGETGQEVFYYAVGERVSYSLTGLSNPTEDSGAATKSYVDSAIAAALAAIPIAEEGSY